jgi:hypothetical protein
MASPTPDFNASPSAASAAAGPSAGVAEERPPELPVGASSSARWSFAGRPVWQAAGFAEIFVDALQGEAVANVTPHGNARDNGATNNGVAASASAAAAVTAAAANQAQGASLRAGAFVPAIELLQHSIGGMVGNHGEWFLSLSGPEMSHVSLLIPALAELKLLSAPPRSPLGPDGKPVTQQQQQQQSSGQNGQSAGWINSRSEAALYDACTILIHRLSTLAMGGFMLVPGGWFHRAQTREEQQAAAAREAAERAAAADAGGQAQGSGPIDTSQQVSLGAGADPNLTLSAQAAANRLGVGHNVLFCVQRTGPGYCFAIINTSEREGLQYHPFDLSTSPHISYRQSLAVDNIPPARLLETSFWLTLLRMQAFPSANSRASFLYETLLPYLAEKPLAAIVADNSLPDRCGAWATKMNPPPASGDQSLVHTLLEAAHFMLRRKNMDLCKVGLVDVLLQWQLMHAVYEDLGSLTAISPSEQRMFQMLCQRLSSSVAAHVASSQPERLTPSAAEVALKGLAQPYAPGEGLIGSPILKSVQAFIEQVHARMNALPRYTIMRNVLAPQLNTSEKGWQTAYQPLPLFGRLRTDESVEGLAGPASMPPQFRPIEFTLVPERARTLDEVSLALRHTDRICQLDCLPKQPAPPLPCHA